MWLKSTSLGDVLRQAFEEHNAGSVKRCLWTGGLWYVYL